MLTLHSLTPSFQGLIVSPWSFPFHLIFCWKKCLTVSIGKYVICRLIGHHYSNQPIKINMTYFCIVNLILTHVIISGWSMWENFLLSHLFAIVLVQILFDVEKCWRQSWWWKWMNLALPLGQQQLKSLLPRLLWFLKITSKYSQLIDLFDWLTRRLFIAASIS